MFTCMYSKSDILLILRTILDLYINIIINDLYILNKFGMVFVINTTRVKVSLSDLIAFQEAHKQFILYSAEIMT